MKQHQLLILLLVSEFGQTTLPAFVKREEAQMLVKEGYLEVKPTAGEEIHYIMTEKGKRIVTTACGVSNSVHVTQEVLESIHSESQEVFNEMREKTSAIFQKISDSIKPRA